MKKLIITILLTVLAVYLSASMRAETVTEGVSLPEPVKEAEPIKAVKTTKVEPKEPVKAVVKPQPKPPAPTGTCASWMKAAGIVDTVSAYALIMRESGCNPNAVNASSGACGLGQQLPCGKWPHTWNEPIGALIDMQNYVFARYGTWAAALSHSYAVNWY